MTALLRELLLKHLDVDGKIRNLSPGLIKLTIEMLDSIPKFLLRRPAPVDGNESERPDHTLSEYERWEKRRKHTVADEELRRRCAGLHRFFENFKATAASSSFPIIKEILDLLLYLSQNCDRAELVMKPYYVNALHRILVELSSENLSQSGGMFQKMKFMLEVLFMARTTNEFLMNVPASIVIAGILKSLLDTWKYDKLRPREGKMRQEIVINLFVSLRSKDTNIVNLATTILKECVDSYGLDRETAKVFYPVFGIEIDGWTIREEFEDMEVVYDTILKLFILHPPLIAPLYSVTKKLLKTSNSHRHETIILLFKMHTSTIPSSGSPEYWELLQNHFFQNNGGDLLKEDADLLCRHSPALLADSLPVIREKWIDHIIRLVKRCPHELAERLLHIFAEAERIKPNFIASPVASLRIEPLLKVGSKDEIRNEMLKESFLRSLCEVYIGHVDKGDLPAAANLAYLILGAFNHDASRPKDWALARVVFRFLTGDNRDALRRAWYLVVLNDILRHQMMADETNPALFRVLREAYRYSPYIHKTVQELIQLNDPSESLMDRISKKLMCDMAVPLKSYHAAMNFIVKKAKTKTQKRRLRTIASLTSHTTERENAKKTFVFPKERSFQENAKVFSTRFFAMVEPLADNKVMSQLVKFINVRLEMLAVEEASGVDNEGNAGRPTVSMFPRGWPNKITARLKKADFETLVLSLSAMISEFPHRAFGDPKTLKVLLGVLNKNDFKACPSLTVAVLMAIVAALDCGCTDEELKDPEHVRWTDEQWTEIKESFRPLFKIVEDVWVPDLMLDNDSLIALRTLLKLYVRIFVHSGKPRDFDSLVELTMGTLEYYERSPLHTRRLSVAFMGVIASEPSLRAKVYKAQLIAATKILTPRTLNCTHAVLLISKYQHWQWTGRNDVPPPEVALIVEEYRTFGRLVRFCGLAPDQTHEIATIARILLVVIPQAERDLEETANIHETSSLFNTSCAGLIRKEAACSLLTMLENKVIREQVTVDMILNLAKVAMDPSPLVRSTFTKKVLDGLCFPKCWTTDSGESKGQLPKKFAALLPLTCLCTSELFQEASSADSYREDIETTSIHLTVFAKSLRLFINRYRSHAVPEHDLHPFNVDNILYDCPEAYPEFIFCWLVPVLAKLDLLSWYKSYEQLQKTGMDDKEMTIVKLIYNCFEVVLDAMISKDSYRLHVLPYTIIKVFPEEMLKYMKYENFQERERQVLLCMLLRKALEDHKRKRLFDDTLYESRYNLKKHLLKKETLFYDVHHLQSDNNHFRPDDEIFQDFFVEMRKKISLSVKTFSEGTSSSSASCGDDQTSTQSGSRWDGSNSQSSGNSMFSRDTVTLERPDQGSLHGTNPKPSVRTQEGSGVGNINSRRWAYSSDSESSGNSSNSQSSSYSIFSREIVRLERPDQGSLPGTSPKPSVRTHEGSGVGTDGSLPFSPNRRGIRASSPLGAIKSPKIRRNDQERNR